MPNWIKYVLGALVCIAGGVLLAFGQMEIGAKVLLFGLGMLGIHALDHIVSALKG